MGRGYSCHITALCCGHRCFCDSNHPLGRVSEFCSCFWVLCCVFPAWAGGPGQGGSPRENLPWRSRGPEAELVGHDGEMT